MKVGIKVSGLDKALREIRQAGEAGEEAVTDALMEAGLRTQAYATQAIQRGPASGRIYEKYNPRRTHQASAPGEAPASDTGRLAGSVAVEQAGPMTVRVGTSLGYGADLELGTSRMLPRPWLVPSAERAAQKVADDIKREFEART